MTMKTSAAERTSRAKTFKSWRKKKLMSIQAFVDSVNLNSGAPVLSNAQVTAWEARGNQPTGEAVRAARAVFDDFPF